MDGKRQSTTLMGLRIDIDAIRLGFFFGKTRMIFVKGNIFKINDGGYCYRVIRNNVDIGLFNSELLLALTPKSFITYAIRSGYLETNFQVFIPVSVYHLQSDDKGIAFKVVGREKGN